ncbi:EF hand domain-containing protein [Eremomyces bilateralis CBS 781.70]|uniref:EF hand domain-containing protein n=1 Tax=Eremomyces bilateralis CBS 781.70 TaxID=1392243 RepID=A0A6G1GFT4_9PEZI|nr:EF hand domain-containing protein [Eremomyces bilateralis CBS 781.70]KAF1816913.1 EF hand domain-containing protein [Eremomyces bilateralis CBS 781.70]
MILRTVAISLLSWAALSCCAAAHGGHDQAPLPPGTDWATRHMSEEHHMNGFDAAVFFHLHDYDNTGSWSPDDIRRTYGLFDQSTRNIPETRKAQIAQKVLELYDFNHDGLISKAEYLAATGNGVTLPDFGTGPGHHGDSEYEYEIHHFEKYHGDDAKEEDLVHPEDIEHFKEHDKLDAENAAWEKRERLGIMEENIPQKFRRRS